MSLIFLIAEETRLRQIRKSEFLASMLKKTSVSLPRIAQFCGRQYAAITI